MHISKIDGEYPVAFKPNNVVFKKENSDSILEHLLLLNLFVIPGTCFPDDRIVKIDVNLITKKPLKGSICNRLKNALKDVCKAQFEVYKDDKNYKYINVFESVERKGNIITAELTRSALEVLKIKRTKNFTRIPIGDALKLKTPNQVGILTLHLSYCNRKYDKDLTFDEIKTSLGIPKEMYLNWPHIRQRIVDPSYAEINKRLKLDWKYKTVKNGNKTIAIRIPKSNNPLKISKIKENDAFDFALECFELLTSEEKENFKKDLPDCVGDTVALSAAVNKFSEQYRKLLEKAKSPEEFLKLKDADY